MKKVIGTLVASVALTISTTLFACGGGSPVAMTFDTDGTLETCPTSTFAQDGGSGQTDEVM